MSIFKFRVWDIRNKKYLPSYADKGSKFFYSYDMNSSDIIPIDWFVECEELENPKRFIVQQFTGLTDKENKEIYEGDILKAEYPLSEYIRLRQEKSDLWQVVFKDGAFKAEIMTYYWTNEPRKECFDLFVEMQTTNVEIVGNICESPRVAKVNT